MLPKNAKNGNIILFRRKMHKVIKQSNGWWGNTLIEDVEGNVYNINLFTILFKTILLDDVN